MTITAISRKDSDSKFVEGIYIAPVDYDDEASLVGALKGQQFLIITLSPTAPRNLHGKIVQAAAKAGIRYIMPNSYAGDASVSKIGEDTGLGPVARAQREEIERLGMQWIIVCCGFWYDYSLGGGEARFGFDFDERTLTLLDDGNTKNSTSTLAQVGRAVAAVLGLNMFPADEADSSLTVSSFLNKPIYLSSFVVSQNDMFASVKRVTGTTDADWTVSRESAKTRFEQGRAQVQQGNMAGFAKMLYGRAFLPEDPANHAHKAQNELLGLPEESLDEATKDAMELAKVLKLRVARMAS